MTTKRNFKWSTQLSVGNSSQEAFFRRYEEQLLKRKGNHSGDFEVMLTGKVLELKSDQYKSTDNFFMERWSKKDEKKPGGPWQAQEHGSDYLIYWFPKQEELFLFDIPTLVLALNPIVETLKPVDVWNHSYTTVGYKVPKVLLISEDRTIPKDGMQMNRYGYLGSDVTELFPGKVEKKG